MWPRGAALMACTRRIYDEAMAAKELLPTMAHTALRPVSSFDGFEVAALPQTLAPLDNIAAALDLLS